MRTRVCVCVCIHFRVLLNAHKTVTLTLLISILKDKITAERENQDDEQSIWVNIYINKYFNVSCKIIVCGNKICKQMKSCRFQGELCAKCYCVVVSHGYLVACNLQKRKFVCDRVNALYAQLATLLYKSIVDLQQLVNETRL